jgi:threonine/homoserine/homoserine lactone efflux protein
LPDLHTLLLFAAASLVVLVIPGPAVLYVVTRGIAQGRRAAGVSVLGVALGNFMHGVFAAVGLSALIASSAAAFTIVKYAGAAYLIFLGIRALAGANGSEVQAVPQHRSHRRLFLQGFVVDLLNPKTALFFLAFLPQFVDPTQGPVAVQMLALGAVFSGLGLVTDGAYALASGTVGERLGPRLERRLERASGAVYIGLGISALLTDGRRIPS